MIKRYSYPFYLIINEVGQPLFSVINGQMWLFYNLQDAYDFLKKYQLFRFIYPSYKKRFVVKVCITSIEEMKEYITSII